MVAVAWPTPRRVLAVVQEPWAAGPLTLAVVDPVKRTVLDWRPVYGTAGEVVRAAAGEFGLALLLQPAWQPRRPYLGPASFLFIDARRRSRSVVLDRVWAGQEPVKRGSSRTVLRWWVPGLALDSAGRRAFVVAGGAPVAEVELGSMRVTYHELREPISLLGRLRNWLEPATQAKGEMEGPQREARWLGGGLLAVSGLDGRGERPSEARGLKLISTRTWAVRTLDREVGGFVAARGLLLAYGCCFRTRSWTLGLTAYDRAGRSVWRLFGRRPILTVQAAAGRAYVLLPSPFPRGRSPWVALVDLSSGQVLRKVQTPWVQLLPAH